MSSAKFDMECFNLKKLMIWLLNNSTNLKSQIGLQLWKTYMMMMMMWASVGLGNVRGAFGKFVD
jgi:hypothetical protein